ncbi:hypothetical protein C7271_09265 [filamentous cyanobacterium CCP5]|nr:hypothetical protein C7271_09265 [filamentous cyanobacterium CCP5]
MAINGFKVRPRWWQVLIGAALVVIGLDLLVYLATELLWFRSLNYSSVITQRLQAQILLFVTGFGLSLIFTWGNIFFALRYQSMPVPETTANRLRGMPLSWLLASAIALSLLVSVQILYQGQTVLSYWRQNYTLYNPTPPPPLWPKPAAAAALIQSIASQPWQLLVVVAIATLLMLFPRLFVRPLAVAMSLGFGVTLFAHWSKVLLGLTPTDFPYQDPIFGRNVGFYIFRLPVLELLEYWLIGLLFFTLAAAILMYLLANDSINRGRFYGFSGPQQRHLYGLTGIFFVVTSFSHWLGRFRILYSQDGVVYGAGYTDVTVSLPFNWVLSILTLVMGLLFLTQFVFWPLTVKALMQWLRSARRGKSGPALLENLRASDRTLRWTVGTYLLTAALGATVIPGLVQRVAVQPNELLRERPYIANSIQLTRSAYDLQDIDIEPFDPGGELTVTDLQNNSLTLQNVRLWDTRPLLESNRQLQEIRLYYEFRDADVDRYTILNEDGSADRRQVIVSARELNYEQVPEIAKTWVNQHLVYTHGYGFTMSPVNTASPGGLPAYFVRGIDQDTSSEAVRQSIPIGSPRIYFGEITDPFLLTNTQVPELDYPSGDENVYTTYTGRAGIDIRGLGRRLLLARRMADWRMLFSEDLLPQSRLQFRRNIRDRVQAIAPFLRFDNDPYLVVADIGDTSRSWGTGNPQEDYSGPAGLDLLQESNQDISPDNYNTQSGTNYLYWIIDAYTVSESFPYSDPGENDFNYIRNSVKVVVDAYHGAVTFYVSDPDDPIIQSWQKLQPKMFQPLEAMPATLRAHIRYPQDLFRVQADALMTYHMTDPQVFYNREDQWRPPNEIYANEAQRVAPYYLIIRLPEGSGEEFILLQLFTPSQRNNLVAWLAARSDGENYGRRLLYRFPKQELVFGPEQIEARINQDPEISQRISLWDTQGSRARQGNLLVIPIERSLLYVEPLYLVAEQNQLPALTRVITVYRNRIAMAETLDDTLSAIFLQERETAPPILRELQEETDTVPGITNLVPAPTGESADSSSSDIPAGIVNPENP